MKIIQLNAWHGQLGPSLKRFIQEQQADIVCLQEAFAPNPDVIYNFQEQYRFVDQIRDAGKLKHMFFSSAWGFELAGTVVDEGNVILSKYPIEDEQSFHTHHDYHIRRKPEDSLVNSRVWQACTLLLPGNKKLSIANYQGYYTGTNPTGDATSLKTMQNVRAGLESLERPLIFCGDLNVSPDSPALNALNNLDLVNLTVKHGVASTLSQAHRAPLPERNKVVCDYIFVSPEIKVEKFSVSDELVSDHKALILEFEL